MPTRLWPAFFEALFDLPEGAPGAAFRLHRQPRGFAGKALHGLVGELDDTPGDDFLDVRRRHDTACRRELITEKDEPFRIGGQPLSGESFRTMHTGLAEGDYSYFVLPAIDDA